ncbi:hypothetical protein DFH29DRAFT_1072487 [Suillus ampliporus]|nr:hypothetical protein DFH29DRAFT_1072487 [Suillus ampliporus]
MHRPFRNRCACRLGRYRRFRNRNTHIRRDPFVIHLIHISDHPRSTHHSSYRAPCPDDPTPRKPPLQLLTRKQTMGELAANTRIKVNTNGKGDDSEVVRRAREVMLYLPNSKPRERGKEKDKERGGVFKVSAVPANIADADVFRPQENKFIIEKFAVRHLDALGAPKSHPEFKELFGFVYRGTAFALRATIKKSPISALALDTPVEAHIKLYAPSPP